VQFELLLLVVAAIVLPFGTVLSLTSMSGPPQKVTFTVRRPTPVSRSTSSGPDSDSGSSFKVPTLPRHLVNDSAPGSPLARSATSSPKPGRRHSAYYNVEPDSSDEDDEALEDELVTGFDEMGVQRLKKVRAPQAPLVIPALKNRDWREFARKRRSAGQYVPPSAKAETGADGSVGGLGVRDTINSGPVLAGLQLKKKDIKEEDEVMVQVSSEIKVERMQETEDERALRAILAGGDGSASDGPIIDIIPTPVSETEAYKQDVDELPDTATLEDYARVPVAQFGAALLRGMGWKEGTAASRKPGKGLVEPYLPEARPALLGIGAKEREVLDDGSGMKKNKRPERKYVPILKQERSGTPASGDRERRRERSSSPRRRNGSSRRSSRSPHDYDRRRNDRDRERNGREKKRDRSRESSRRSDYY